MSRFRTLAINVLVTAVLLVVFFAVCELAVQVWLRALASDEAFHRYASLRQLRAADALAEDPARRYSPHRYLGYYATPNHRDGANFHNSLGYRGEEIPLAKPEGEFRIVCMGGSTTYTAVRSPKWAYPYLLEKILRERGHDHVTVVNAGVEGWTTYETLINFQLRVVELDPDLIIIYHNANDVMARFVYPPEAYRSDNSGIRGPNVSEVFMPPLWEHSSFLRVIGIQAGWTQSHASLSRTLVQALPTDVAAEWGKQVIEGRYPSGLFETIGIRELLEGNPPVYFKRNLESIIAIAQSRGIETLLATFAITPERNESPFGNHPEFVWTYDEANDIIKDIAATHDHTHLYDFAAEFPKAPEWWADELHVNHEGSELKAKMFADFLEAEGMIP